MKFYHVDRYKKLKPNTFLDYDFNLKRIVNLAEYSEEVRSAIDKFYNGKLSYHGAEYLLFGNKNIKYETILEHVRINYFLNIRSRYQSIFAWDNLEDAKKFDDNKDSQIIEIESLISFKADMKLLSNCKNYADIFRNAFLYWQQLPNTLESPMWEYLLPLPAKLGNIVE